MRREIAELNMQLDLRKQYEAQQREEEAKRNASAAAMSLTPAASDDLDGAKRDPVLTASVSLSGDKVVMPDWYDIL